jgi:hypothetical protein
VTLPVTVSEHARWRAAERFRGFDTVRIEEEVVLALAEGRVSPRKPPGLRGVPDPGSLYAWTPDGVRVYTLRHDPSSPDFRVTTTMRAELPRA